MTDEQQEHFNDYGYFYADDATPTAMVADLEAAARRVYDKVRNKDVELFTHRTDTDEPWAIRGLFAPEFNEPIFADYMMCDEVMPYVHAVLGEELRLGAVLIFTNPRDQDWGFGWHRDFGKHPRDASEEEELAILNQPQTSIKWHLALEDDECLQLVPGSHRRYRTDYEFACLSETRHADIPGQRIMYMKKGQTLFWHGYALHRGVMKKDVERMSIASSWSKHSDDDEPKEVDKRLRWMLADNVREFLPEPMHVYYDRWRNVQIETAEGESG